MPAPGPAPCIVILGGGAAGYFGAIHAAEAAPDAQVILLEATRTPLQKVRISGGGRCNVTHNLFDPAQLVKRYPRGEKELRGVLARFGPKDTMAWFESRRVALKAEADGRVFPTTDSSETIIDALQAAAAWAGVEVRVGTTIRDATPEEGGGFALALNHGEPLHADALLLATGSNPNGLALAAKLGHSLIPGVPSLFTFNIKDPVIDGLSGVSVAHVKARAKTPDGDVFEQEGPLLITHWGMSGPAVLRVSAWGARAFHASGYAATLAVDWVPHLKDDALRTAADRMKAERSLGSVGSHGIAEEVPRRLWDRLVVAAGCRPDMRWVDVPKKDVNRMIEALKRSSFTIAGKGRFKEEFVTAGGVNRKEVDWRTMESRKVPGLFLAGEILDVDALTGGFNFQNAWSTGYLAGLAMGERATSPSTPQG